MFKILRRFRTEDMGAIAAFVAVVFPVLLLVGGMATDVSLLNAQKRHAQSQADLAAQSAARYLPDAAKVRSVAREVVLTNATYGALTLRDDQIELGSYAPQTGFVRATNQANPVGATAVRVNVASPFEPILLKPVLSEQNLLIQRRAIGAREGVVVFTLRNRLLSLNTREAALNSLLGPLGLGLTLNVLGYEGLANARVKLDKLLGLVSLGLAAEAVTFNDVLELPLTMPILLPKLLQTPGFPSGSLAPGVAPSKQVTLKEILNVSPSLLHAKIADILPNLTVNAFDLVMAYLGLAANPTQRLGVATDIKLDPLASLSLELGLIRPPVIAIGRIGDRPPPTARVSQLSALVNANVLQAGAAPLLRLVANLQVGSAEARAVSLNCSAQRNSDILAAFDADTAPLNLSLRLSVYDTRSEVPPKDVTPYPLAGKTQRINVRLDQFRKPVPISNPLTVTGLLSGISSVLDDFKANLTNQTRTCRGLIGILLCPLVWLYDVTLGALIDVLKGIIAGLTWVLEALGVDKVLQALLRLLGIELAQAELILDDYSCNTRLLE